MSSIFNKFHVKRQPKSPPDDPALGKVYGSQHNLAFMVHELEEEGFFQEGNGSDRFQVESLEDDAEGPIHRGLDSSSSESEDDNPILDQVKADMIPHDQGGPLVGPIKLTKRHSRFLRGQSKTPAEIAKAAELSGVTTPTQKRPQFSGIYTAANYSPPDASAFSPVPRLEEQTIFIAPYYCGSTPVQTSGSALDWKPNFRSPEHH